jgi:formate/nitrite transporter FocA (FNT family)
LKNPYESPPDSNDVNVALSRARWKNLATLFVLVAVGAIAGWFLGLTFIWQNPIFSGTGRLFLILWAVAMVAGGTAGAVLANRMSRPTR